MKQILANLQNNIILKKILFLCILLFSFLYIFSIPSFSGRPKLNIIPYFFIVALILFTLLYLLIYEKKVPYKSYLLMFSFAIWCGVGTILFSHNFRDWLTIIFLVLSSFVLFLAFSCIKNSRITSSIISFALFAFCVYFIIFYSRKIFDLEYLKNGGFQLGLDFDNTNSIGFCLFLLFTISFFRLLHFKKTLEIIVFSIFIIVSFFCGILTGSRGFIINSSIAIIIIVITRFKTKKWLAILILLSIVATVAIVINLPFASFIQEKFLKMFSMFLSNGSDTSATERLLWQINGLYLGSKNPFVGYGMNGFAVYSGVGTYTHGNFAEIFCDYGVPGLLLFYGTLFILIRGSLVSKDQMHFLTFAFGCVFFLNSITSLYYTDKSFYVVLAMGFISISNSFNLTKRYKDYCAIII